jgi:hypothetical protein
VARAIFYLTVDCSLVSLLHGNKFNFDSDKTKNLQLELTRWRLAGWTVSSLASYECLNSYLSVLSTSISPASVRSTIIHSCLASF